ncbi:MAG: hypothetical protein JRE40_15295 [Deltaproteobacteria bacterium]|nr:hypothetical protein [Deltaproteobacteria bacterium]
MGETVKYRKEVKPTPKKFSEVVKTEGAFRLPLLSELVGKEFEIQGVAFGEGRFGEYAVVDVKGLGKYRTSSEVLLRQLEEIADFIDREDDTVIVKLAKVKNYYTFQ